MSDSQYSKYIDVEDLKELDILLNKLTNYIRINEPPDKSIYYDYKVDNDNSTITISKLSDNQVKNASNILISSKKYTLGENDRNSGFYKIYATKYYKDIINPTQPIETQPIETQPIEIDYYGIKIRIYKVKNKNDDQYKISFDEEDKKSILYKELILSELKKIDRNQSSIIRTTTTSILKLSTNLNGLNINYNDDKNPNLWSMFYCVLFEANKNIIDFFRQCNGFYQNLPMAYQYIDNDNSNSFIIHLNDNELAIEFSYQGLSEKLDKFSLNNREHVIAYGYSWSINEYRARKKFVEIIDLLAVFCLLYIPIPKIIDNEPCSPFPNEELIPNKDSNINLNTNPIDIFCADLFNQYYKLDKKKKELFSEFASYFRKSLIPDTDFEDKICQLVKIYELAHRNELRKKNPHSKEEVRFLEGVKIFSPNYTYLNRNKKENKNNKYDIYQDIYEIRNEYTHPADDRYHHYNEEMLRIDILQYKYFQFLIITRNHLIEWLNKQPADSKTKRTAFRNVYTKIVSTNLTLQNCVITK